MTSTAALDPVIIEELTRSFCSDLQEHTRELEIGGDLPLGVAELLTKHRLTSLCLPERLGGRGGSLGNLVIVVERVAAVDAATGWCLFIMATAPWLLCHATPQLTGEVFADPEARIAGGLAPTGTARTVERGGYVVDGRWAFGSGVNRADWVVVHVTLPEHTTARSAFALIPASEVSYREPWDGLGLDASGSGAFGIEHLMVPAGRFLSDVSGPATWPEPMFRMSFRATFAAGAAVLLGIASHALEEFTSLAAQKRPTYGRGLLADQDRTRALVADCWAQVSAARFLLHQSVLGLEAACADGAPSVRLQAELRIAICTVRQLCLSVVDRLHFSAGGSAAQHSSGFAKLLRDAHTASQHHMFGDDVRELAGAVLLGHTEDGARL